MIKALNAVPKPALWLGLSGAVPFVSLALLTLAGWAWAAAALLGYGVAILAFMGGIHWGLAMANNRQDWGEFGGSVVPALLGWLAHLTGGALGFWLLAAAFFGLFVYDLRSVRAGQAPAWYPALRRPLTVIVVLSLSAAAIGV